MPDRNLPPRWRTTLRLLRALVYVAVTYAGLAALLWTPRTIAGALGVSITYSWAVLAIAGAGLALVGLIRDAYRLEWVAVWFAAAGTSAYAVTVWSLVATEAATRQTQAAVCTGLTLALLVRAAELSAHAAKLRADHARKA